MTFVPGQHVVIFGTGVIALDGQVCAVDLVKPGTAPDYDVIRFVTPAMTPHGPYSAIYARYLRPWYAEDDDLSPLP